MREPNSEAEKKFANVALEGFKLGLEIAKTLHHQDKDVFWKLCDYAIADTKPFIHEETNTLELCPVRNNKPLPDEGKENKK